MSDFIPSFVPRKPKKFTDEPWLSFEEPQVILWQGMRSSGKGVAVDNTAEQLYKAGINIWHLWGARSFENLYWAVNKNCQEYYKKMKVITNGFYQKESPGLETYCLQNGLKKEEYDRYLKIMQEEKMILRKENKKWELLPDGMKLHDNELLHCNCFKAYPILWIVPDYIEIDQESLDRFNGVCWKNWEEYNDAYVNCRINQFLPNSKFIDFANQMKPDELIPKPLIVVAKITTPTSANRKEIFREQFTKIVLDAREQHRIVVLNPVIFEGSNDKFDTITEIFRMLAYLMNKSGHFKPLNNPKNKWEKSWHKVAIVINELRSVAPSSRLSGESKAGSSKKAIFDMIPEMRHMKTWFLGDYQNPDDLYSGVRYQANVVVIKNASRNILGADWAWLFERIEYNRQGMIDHRFGGVDEKYPFVKAQLDKVRPKIDELPRNKGYITFPNNEIDLETFDMPSFHHKTSLEDFQADTGIRWIVNHEKKSKDSSSLSQSERKESSRKKKSEKEEVFKKIDYLRQTQGKSWPQIKDELVLLENEGMIPVMNYADKKPTYFSNEYGKWKKKQTTNAFPKVRDSK